MSLKPLLIRDVQVAELLGVHRNTVWNRVRAGRFPKPIKWDGLTRWKVKDIEEFVASLGTEGIEK